METVLSNDVTVQQAMLVYIDDMFINKSVAPAERVEQHFFQFGLESKDPEQLEYGTRVLDLEVEGESGSLRWKRGSGCPRGCNRSNYFFSVRETDQASASV